jgi:hypothetical protein
MMRPLAKELEKVQIVLGRCRHAHHRTNSEGFGQEEQDAIEGFLSAVKDYVDAGRKSEGREPVFKLA